MSDERLTKQEIPSGPDPDRWRRELAGAYDSHAPALYRYAVMILADADAAEDAVQQAFAKLAAMGSRIGEIAFRNDYLRIAVRNECYRMLRQRSRPVEMNGESTSILERPEKTASDREQRLAVEKGLRALPADQREVVHLKVYEGMTFRQIAETLDVPIHTAASRYRYAVGKLRRLLAALCQEEGQQHGRE